MYVPRISEFFFGYRIFEVEKERIKEAAGLLLSIGVQAKFQETGAFAVRTVDLERVRGALSGKLPYREGALLGLPGFFYRKRKCYGAFCAIFLISLLAFFSTRVVWDVRIECEGEIDESLVKDQLAEVGLYPGAPWRSLDKSEIETKLLSISDEVAWVNVNQRGTVAYIRVVKREIGKEPEEHTGYANIIATEDAVIEELTVSHGYEVVKVGETVKKGQLLVSGIYPSEAGGGLCYAEGEVLGRVAGEVITDVLRTYETYEYKEERLLEMRLNFFGFSINIFKNYGNSGEACDIIENTTVCTLFDKCALPISVYRVIGIPKTARVMSYTDEQLVAKARSVHEDALSGYLSSGDLSRISTEGGFTDEGYTLTSHVVAVLPIGKTVPIKAEE